MAIRKITKKITPVKVEPTVEVESVVEEVAEQADEKSSKTTRTKKVCVFCQSKTSPTYTDLATLRRFLTDRAKIVGKERSGVCSKHQRTLAKNIKWARHLSLLPFVPKV